MQQPDILIYMSDQHSGPLAGFMGDPVARTPNLDQIAAQATVFTQAYTSCPLCVPARASMMTARFPSALGVFSNDDAFSSQHPTFAHSLGAAGYETVLCGRMHFIGEDQRHGFEHRIAEDLTAYFWGYPTEKRKDLGDFGRTFYQKHCLEIIGAGNSPVLAYDDYVTRRAIEYLSVSYERPQLLVVGAYGPHFPYIAPPAMFWDYNGKVMQTLHSPEAEYPINAAASKIQRPLPEDLKALRCAYYAMTERMDLQIGQVYRAFREYLTRTGRQGIFVYLSDHGDQIGEKGFFGKQTFFEYSAKIPLLIQTEDKSGKAVDLPVSIMDLGPTLCALAGAPVLPLADGVDQSQAVLAKKATARPVISEFFDRGPNGTDIVGRMVREGAYKYITYSGYEAEDLLFDIHTDPWEQKNLRYAEPETVARLSNIAQKAGKMDALKLAAAGENRVNSAFLAKWGEAFPYKNKKVFSPPEELRIVPEANKRPQYMC